MLERKRAEQEAAERERERQEQERLALLEEKRRRDEEERLRREQQEREEAERQRIADEKKLVREEFGDAMGMSVENLQEDEPEEVQLTEEDIEAAKTAIEAAKTTAEESDEEFEDPREVAARMKRQQQKREKERAERERAERLKAERQYFENKPFMEIYKEYTKNPFYAIPRFIMYLLAVIFGFIPENTDNPDLKTRLADITEKRRIRTEEKQKHKAMEVYYKKYADAFPYNIMRSIDDRKFRRKRAKEMRGKPKPVYNPPVRTPEQEEAIRQEMNRLYRTYSVSFAERIRRKLGEIQHSRRSV